MTRPTKARVFRFDPQRNAEPYYDGYGLELDEPTSVLVLLDRIQRRMDSTLSFRSFCCGLQMCRSCLMKINKTKRYACLVLVEPGDEILIEPVTFPDWHIKDLVVKLRT